MSDECLIKQETVISLYVVYQAVMRKFTLAGKSKKIILLNILEIFICTVLQLICCIFIANDDGMGGLL